MNLIEANERIADLESANEVLRKTVDECIEAVALATDLKRMLAEKSRECDEMRERIARLETCIHGGLGRTRE